MFPGKDTDGSGLLIQSAGVTLRNLVLESGETAKDQMALIYIHYVNGTEDAPIIIENNTLICEQNTIGIQTTYKSGSNLIIKDNEIYDSKYGMYFNQISNSIIENNIIERTKYNGIIIAGDSKTYTCDNVVVQNNELNNIATADYPNKTYATGIYVGPFTNDVTVDDTNNVDMYISSNPSIHFEKDGILVGDEESLKQAIDKSGNIKLSSDIVLSKQIRVLDKDIKIDLAGKKITPSSELNIKGGLFLIDNGGKLTINDSTGSGVIDVTKGETENFTLWACFVIYPDPGYKSELIINGGTFKAGSYPISGNGSCEESDCTNIIINGGTFESVDGLAIYHPQNGSLTINDGIFNGQESAVEIRSGNLTINGGVFTATNTPSSSTPNGNGTTSNGVAIAVAQHTTEGAIKVKITDGTFNGYTALYETNPQNNSQESISNVQIEVSGGTFNAINNGKVAVYSQDCEEFIKGGNFSTDPFEYLAVGSFAERNSDGTFTVTQKDYVEITEENKAEHYDEYRNLGTIAYASNIMAMLNEAAGYYEGVGFKSTEDGGVYYSFENARITLSRNALETKLNVEFPEEDYPDSFQVTLNGTVYVHTEENGALDEMIFDFTDGYTINEVRHTGYFRMKQTTSSNPKYIVLLDDTLLYGIEVFMPSSSPSNP